MKEMDRGVPNVDVDNDVNPSNNQSLQSNNNNVEQTLRDKLTPLLLRQNELYPQDEVDFDAETFYPQQSFGRMRVMESNGDEGGSRQMDMDIKIQEDYEDIQFFHHKLLLQQHLGQNEFGIGNSVSTFGSQNGRVNISNSADVDTFQAFDDNGNGNNFSENPFVFSDNNVMEYGEPQFFPGNTFGGYLETILEETDEEFEEEEESCSGRHWWQADSDTDTDSVIRVVATQPPSTNPTNLKSIENVENLSLQSTFRSSASSRPFELEDLHLLDQLDLAFEETLMEPRRRSGFAAFGAHSHLLDQPLEKQSRLDNGVTLQRSASHDGETTTFTDFLTPMGLMRSVPKMEEDETMSHKKEHALNTAESKETFGSSLSPSTSDSSGEGPNEVAEEDFFYSSPGSDESEEGSSSSDDSDKASKGVVLAEFSLTQNLNNLHHPSFSSFGKSSKRLKSFRSFDSLNSLSGTELLFSKADTFPSFHYIKEELEPGAAATAAAAAALGVGSSGDAGATSLSVEAGEAQSLPSSTYPGAPFLSINRSSRCQSNSSSSNSNNKKGSSSSSSSSSSNSGSGATVVSSENLSEDSGIGVGADGGAKQSCESFLDDEESGGKGGDYAKSEFALNPLVFSSLSSDSASLTTESGGSSLGNDPQLLPNHVGGGGGDHNGEVGLVVSTFNPNTQESPIYINNPTSQCQTFPQSTNHSSEKAEYYNSLRPVSPGISSTSPPGSSISISTKEQQQQPNGSASASPFKINQDQEQHHLPCKVPLKDPLIIPPAQPDYGDGSPKVPEQDSFTKSKLRDGKKRLSRERSSSESDFESVESALELDSIALAYAIVNCPTIAFIPTSSTPTPPGESKSSSTIAIANTPVPGSLEKIGAGVVDMGLATLRQLENSSASAGGMQKWNQQSAQKMNVVRIVRNEVDSIERSGGMVVGQQLQEQHAAPHDMMMETEWNGHSKRPSRSVNFSGSEEQQQEQISAVQQPLLLHTQQSEAILEGSKFGYFGPNHQLLNLDPKSQSAVEGEKKISHLDHIILAPSSEPPSNFTLPLAVYSATVCAVASTLPTQRLVFLNEHNTTTTTAAEIHKENVTDPQAKEPEEGGAAATGKKDKHNPEGPHHSTSASPNANENKVNSLLETTFAPKSVEILEMEQQQQLNGRERSISPSIKTKTYGTRNQVEVVVIRSRSPSPAAATPSASSLKPTLHPSTSEDCKNLESQVKAAPAPRSRVHFSPVVSEISWRESYIDQGSSLSNSKEELAGDEGNVGEDEALGGINWKSAGHYQQQQQQQQVLVEKVKMSSTFLQNSGSDSEDSDELERKLTMTIHLDPNEEDGGRGHIHGGDDRRGSGALELYEDVSVLIEPEVGKTGQGTTTNLSMVPDLLSQCEDASGKSTQIHVSIEQVHEPPPPPRNKSSPSAPLEQQQQQQQIFPKIFAQDGPPTKNNSSSSLNKKEKGKGGKSSKAPETDQSSKENKTKGGFFERLSKIRLSGSKQKKQKVHPKEDAGGALLKTGENAKLKNGTASKSTSKLSSTTTQPILKKTHSSQSTPSIPNYGAVVESEPEPEASQAFENILEEIAGIKSIKMRMDKERASSAPPPPKEMRSFAKRKQFYETSATEPSSPSPPLSPDLQLDAKLSAFKRDTCDKRVVISKSHPDLELIEDMVRQQSIPSSALPNETVPSANSLQRQQQQTSPTSSQVGRAKSPKKSPEKSEREWYKLLKSAAEKYYYKSKEESGRKDKEKGSSGGGSTGQKKTSGVVETDLDTGTSREMLDDELVELDKKVPFYAVSTSEIPFNTSTPITTIASSPTVKARSLTNLSTRLPLSIAPSMYSDDVDHLGVELNDFDERAKSYEFLLDDNQKCASVPPENKLRTETRQLSEHELCIQRSLQRINVPEWYKKHESSTRTSTTSTPERPTSGQDSTDGKMKILSRRTEYGSAGGLAGGWAGLSAFKAPSGSMSSLQNSNVGRYTGSLNRSNFIRGKPATMSATRLSRESLTGTGSASHSPSAYDRSSFTYGMPFALTRFGQGRLSNNSGTVTPTSTSESMTSTTAATAYVKKPYLGWRSQERINALVGASADGPPKLSVYLPPEERLAADVLRSRTVIRPPLSDRPPLPKPPPRSEKTTLTKSTEPREHQQAANNSIPPPQFQSSNIGERNPTATVHDSIREVTKAINQYVAEGEVPKANPRKHKSPSRKAIWIESSFVGRKPAGK